MQPKEDTPQQNASCYLQLKPAKSIIISCQAIQLQSIQTIKTTPSDQVSNWLLLLEEYGVSFEYLPGKKNVVADALSRLDIDDLKIQEEEVLALLSE